MSQIPCGNDSRLARERRGSREASERYVVAHLLAKAIIDGNETVFVKR